MIGDFGIADIEKNLGELIELFREGMLTDSRVGTKKLAMKTELPQEKEKPGEVLQLPRLSRIMCHKD